jgi:very-short-patch-repair endonuclease
MYKKEVILLCNVCREDLDSSNFSPEEFLKARTNGIIPMCFLCQKLNKNESNKKRDNCIRVLGGPIIEKGIPKRRKKKSKNKSSKNKIILRNSHTKEQWDIMSLEQKRYYLKEHRTWYEKVIEGELLHRQIDYDIQVSVGSYFLDFHIFPVKLAVEIDGGYHKTNNQKELDQVRTEFLQKAGWTVMRFSNERVKESINYVVDKIEKEKCRLVKEAKKDLSKKIGVICVKPGETS